MDFRQQLGANLRRLRDDAGLSQEELMRLADVHRTQISSYERGETEPQAEVLARLSRALGVSAEEFFAGIGWQQEPPRLVVESSTDTCERSPGGLQPLYGADRMPIGLIDALGSLRADVRITVAWALVGPLTPPAIEARTDQAGRIAERLCIKSR